jgi:hypothetical protein
MLPLTNIPAKLPNSFGGRGFSLLLWRVCEELKTRQQPLQRRQQQQQQQKTNNGGKEFRAFRALSLQEESAKRT